MSKRKIVETDQFTLFATDKPDPNGGGACHLYEICTQDGKVVETIKFQKGPIKEVGINGIPDILLGEILKDRLQHFQSGPYPSPYNDWGLDGIKTYVKSQNSRTADRKKREVEGENKK